MLVTPAAPAGGETLAVTASNAAISVPAGIPIGTGLANAQFVVTATPSPRRRRPR